MGGLRETGWWYGRMDERAGGQADGWMGNAYLDACLPLFTVISIYYC